jgi:hypothetical protein
LEKIIQTPEGDKSQRIESGWGFLEVLDRAGHVTQRVRITSLPLWVGRAYDNDVIIEDFYVSPRHLRLEVGEDHRLVAEDLDSVNGLFGESNSRHQKRINLASGQAVRIGHTLLRYRDRNYVVPPARKDWHAWNVLRAFENPLMLLLIFALTWGLLLTHNLMSNVEKRESAEIAYELISPFLLILLWAGLWAFASKLLSNRFNFMIHCAIACLGLIALTSYNTMIGYVVFSVGADDVHLLLEFAGILSILGVMFYAHLRFCTLAASEHLAAIVLIIVAVASLLLLERHIHSDEFSAYPEYEATLKPPAYRWVPGETVDSFFAHTQELRAKLREETEEAPP